jgi:hypothetical protein
MDVADGAGAAAPENGEEFQFGVGGAWEGVGHRYEEVTTR